MIKLARYKLPQVPQMALVVLNRSSLTAAPAELISHCQLSAGDYNGLVKFEQFVRHESSFRPSGKFKLTTYLLIFRCSPVSLMPHGENKYAEPERSESQCKYVMRLGGE